MEYRRFLKEQRTTSIPKDSSFYGLSDDELETHLRIKKYGDFLLPRAVSPSYDLKIVPKAGFRRTAYLDGDEKVFVITISASSEKIMDLFFELAGLLGRKVDVFLETRHADGCNNVLENDGFNCDHNHFVSEDVNTAVALSTLVDFEDLMLDDGCFGVALAKSKGEMELHLDDHKVLLFYGWKRAKRQILKILARYGIALNNDLYLICNAEHVHTSNIAYCERFRQIVERMGAIRD